MSAARVGRWTLRASKSWTMGAGVVVVIITSLFVAGETGGNSAAAEDADVGPPVAAAVSGREVFLREWLPGDTRSHGGDGLGPVFNDSSCIACHNQGGPGGGGPSAKNVTIISAAVNVSSSRQPKSFGMVEFMFRLLTGELSGDSADEKNSDADPQVRTAMRKELLRKQLQKDLLQAHPGFQTSRSVVLHSSGTDPEYDAWRSKYVRSTFPLHFGMGMSAQAFSQIAVPVSVPTEVATFSEVEFEVVEQGEDSVAEPVTLQPASHAELQPIAAEKPIRHRKTEEMQKAEQQLQRVRIITLQTSGIGASTTHFGDTSNVSTVTSQRNPTALFGAGLIDSIPEAALKAQAAVKHKNPHVTGRVAKLADGKIGRFGWKAQKASLYDFTVTACAVELGLHVPDHPQSGQPLNAKYQPKGFDLNQPEVDALVDYLKNLPAPSASESATRQQREFVAAGRRTFEAIGCTACHVEKLGEVTGIYSDLLLHDMGESMADTGGYGVFIPNSPGGETNEPFPALADAFKASMKPASSAVQRGQTPTLVQPDEKTIGATRLEWRTPPLWGVRDSAPYMHDGRAPTLEHAIAMHGGEGHAAARNYFARSSTERQQLIAFIKTLVAPTDGAERLHTGR